MSDINTLVLEIFNTSVSFTKSDMETDSSSSQKEYDNIDHAKADRASSITGMPRSMTTSIQKYMGGMGGIDKYLNRPGIEIPMMGKRMEHVQKRATARFNKIMGEKVL